MHPKSNTFITAQNQGNKWIETGQKLYSLSSPILWGCPMAKIYSEIIGLKRVSLHKKSIIHLDEYEFAVLPV